MLGLLPVTFLVRADELCVGQHMALHFSVLTSSL